MGLFGSKKEGGLMDVIRCDQKEYLVWKWHPEGHDVNSTSRENSIRYGSSLRVKDGELAIFVYKQKDGVMQDFIVGPYDQTIKTANFPILTSIVGAAFGGTSPFQAEIYFMNLSGNIQVRFGIPWFDVYDPRFLDFAVPLSARGTITFNITDYKAFIKLNRLIHFEIEDFNKQIKDAVTKNIKGVITNMPSDNGIPVMQIEKKLLQINDIVATYLKPRLENDFGVNMKSLDLSSIEADKESDGYRDLKRVTADQQTKTIEAQTNVNITNLSDLQKINAQNLDKTLEIQREEAQRAQKLQTETNYLQAHQLNTQADVLKTAANNLGQMGTINSGGVGNGGGGMNPAGMMTGMMIGGAMGNQMANMTNQMGQNMNQQMNQNMNTPPPPGISHFMLSINGQQSGPFTIQQLQQMALNGQFDQNIHVWKQGMSNWVIAGEVQELLPIFGNVPPPPPM